ncbi:MAG: protein CpxP [Chitinophagales bacterium]|jgi:protein CpxP
MLCLNLALLAFIFFGRHPRRGHEGPKAQIIERLEFDQEQIDAYEVLIKEHQLEVQKLNEYINGLKSELYEYLSQEDQEMSDSILQLIGEKKMQKEQLHFTHFLDLKNLCNENQMDLFTLLEKDLVKLFSKKHLP